MSVVAILLAGGTGSRAGFDRPKQMVDLNGQPVITWSLSALYEHRRVSSIVLVCSDYVREALSIERTESGSTAMMLAKAGDSRRASVANGLRVLSGYPDDSIILVHDSARPGLSLGIIDRLIAAIEAGNRAAIPALPVSDTLARVVRGSRVALEWLGLGPGRKHSAPQKARLSKLPEK